MKTRLFKNVAAFLFAGMALTWVGCSDYDDDIENLNNRIDELTTGKIASIEAQHSSLQSTMTSLQGANTALQNKISEVQQNAPTTSDLTKLETAQATIKSAVESLEGQLEGFMKQSELEATLASYATAEALAEVQAAVEGISDSVVNKAIADATASAIEAAGKAMEESFQAKFDAALASANLVDGDQLKAKLEEAMAQMDEKVAAAIEEAMKNEGVVDGSIAETLSEAVAAVKKYIHGRLTSLLLIPDLYVDGIETVEIHTMRYNALTYDAAEETYTAGNNIYTTSWNWDEIRFTVGPKVVATSDIEKPRFVFNESEVHKTRSTEDVTPELEVIDYDIKGGVLTVKAVKRAEFNTVNNRRPMVWIGALEAPIAKDHLMEGEEGAVVRSDWARFVEIPYDLRIASLIDLMENKDKDHADFDCDERDRDHHHFSATYEAAKRVMPSNEITYRDTLDLTAMVTGCLVREDRRDREHVIELTKEDMAKSGIELRFSAPTEPYKVGANDTDQQKFIKIEKKGDKWIAIPVLPDGRVMNEAAIDKTPIVKVEMIDTNNEDAIVDVRYFQVKWTQVRAEDIYLGVIKNFEYTLSDCDFFGHVTWNDVVTKVLAEMKDNDGDGVSYREMYDYYNWAEAGLKIESEDHIVGECANASNWAIHTGNIWWPFTLDYEKYEFVHLFDERWLGESDVRSSTAMYWHLTTRQVGTVIEQLKAGEKVTRRVDVTITPKDEHYADYGPLHFSLEVEIKLPVLAVMAAKTNLFWYGDNNEIARICPVQYASNYKNIDAYGKTGETAVYDYALHKLFVENVFLNQLMPCSKWDLVFKSTGDWFYPEVANNAANSAAYMHHPEAGSANALPNQTNWQMPFDPEKKPWYQTVDCNHDYEECECPAKYDGAAKIRFAINNNNEGKALLIYNDGKPQTEMLQLRQYINGYNTYVVAEFPVEYIKPLFFKNIKDLEYEDQMTLGCEADYTKLFTIEDFVGEAVNPYAANGLAKELADYYVASKIQIDWNNAVVVEENNRTAQSVFGTANKMWYEDNVEKGTAKFFNWTGVKVEKARTIKTVAKITHKWGVETVNFTIKVNPSSTFQGE